jgi:hypothetical protein
MFAITDCALRSKNSLFLGGIITFIAETDRQRQDTELTTGRFRREPTEVERKLAGRRGDRRWLPFFDPASDWFGPQRCRERSMFKGRAARFEVWPGYGKAGFQIRITWRSGRASFLGCFASFEEARGWIDREAKTWLW